MNQSESGRGRPVKVEDGRGIAALNATLQDWEPSLELTVPPRDALLYEPDGTLYAVCLGASQSCRYGHRTVEARRGDLLVVPEAFAVDVTTPVLLLGVRAAGFTPDHFRERFLQVWGFEHLPAAGLDSGLDPVLPPDDLRHRINYAVAELPEGGPPVDLSDADPLVLIGLEGNVLVEGDPTHESARGLPHLESFPIGEGEVAALSPGQSFRATGPGRLGILYWLNSPTHEKRRRDGTGAPRTLSPEYRGDRGGGTASRSAGGPGVASNPAADT